MVGNGGPAPRRRRPTPSAPLACRCGTACTAARIRPRRQAADHQRRRARRLSRHERGRLRGAARRLGNHRDPAGAVPVVTRGGCAVPRRGRRRVADAERRVRAVPVGTHHLRAVAARRQRRAACHRVRPLGPRRPRRGAPGMPGADRAGDPVGIRRHPSRQPPRRAERAARVLRCVPGTGGRVRIAGSADLERRAAPAGLPPRRPRRIRGRGDAGPGDAHRTGRDGPLPPHRGTARLAGAGRDRVAVAARSRPAGAAIADRRLGLTGRGPAAPA